MFYFCEFTRQDERERERNVTCTWVVTWLLSSLSRAASIPFFSLPVSMVSMLLHVYAHTFSPQMPTHFSRPLESSLPPPPPPSSAPSSPVCWSGTKNRLLESSHFQSVKRAVLQPFTNSRSRLLTSLASPSVFIQPLRPLRLSCLRASLSLSLSRSLLRHLFIAQSSQSPGN